MENISDEFINAGVDDSVLVDLKNLWLYKLIQSRVLSHESSTASGEPDMAALITRTTTQKTEGNGGEADEDEDDYLTLSRRPIAPPVAALKPPQVQQKQQQSARAGAESPSRPSKAPAAAARNIRQLDGAVDGDDDFQNDESKPFVELTLQQLKPTAPRRRNIRQLDGQHDEEDDEDELFDDEDDEDEAEEDDDGGDIIAAAAAASKDDDELGSDLDDDEDELEAEMESANRMLCQFEKVHRSKNKWKCQFRDGIISINGSDYCISKSQADFEF